ncbi:MAG: Hsp70 family protein [Gammaproteobacteria bacterium]|jgi:molecular chaperone DnaK (HSP70)
MTQFIVGIDLGTTNTVVAYADRSAGPDAVPQIFEIEQLVALGEVAARPSLPSLRYHPAPGEIDPGDLVLPWSWNDVAGVPEAVIGSLARELGSQVPGRLVASAKSWLSHAGVDRSAAILPWGAAEEVAKISPVLASASYLAHVRAAWNHRFPAHPLETQEIVLTVPASFDEAARALTLEAARLAGLSELRLLEEPQAAFYDWLFRHGDRLSDALAGTRLVLVCDVGGGTTDLTLIKAGIEEGRPVLTRVGVGDHLMLGGDNMDLALAHVAESRLAASGGALGGAQLTQLMQQCRNAKERLLGKQAPEEATVTLLGAGSRLIGGARSAALSRDEVQHMIVDGFFPASAPDDQPQRVRGGIVEFGLPYVADPAVTRHLAAFLARHEIAAREALADSAPPPGVLPVPDAVLLNGGVFRSRSLPRRLLDVLGGWRGEGLNILENREPELAVARGAVAYALARAGAGPRISGGSPRSFYLLLGEEGGECQGVCLLPRGSEEGQSVELPERSFALRVGQPVQFHLMSSSADTPCQPGELSRLDRENFHSLPPIATVLDAASVGGLAEIPVKLVAALTEIGTLQVHCVRADDSSQRWQLEFQLRGGTTQAGKTAAVQAYPRLAEAAGLVARIYGSRLKDVGPRDVKRLRSELEKILGARDQWDTPLLRELFGVLWDGVGRRRRSADHERVWFNLAGFCLRPGFGYPLDDWRIEQLWPLFEQGVQFVPQAQVWSEWWTLWRRAAGGLGEAMQTRVLDDIAYYLQPPGKAAVQRPPGARRQGYDDMVRLAAALERVAVARKIEVGEWLLTRLKKPSESTQSWWAVGRIGARVPFHGSAHNAVPPDVAHQWLERLLEANWKKHETAAFAAATIARASGDRERDLDADVRRRVLEALAAIKAPDTWLKMVSEVVELSEADERRSFGESLPPGLKLIH